MKKRIILKRPDKIYHTWHYCTCHYEVFSHSQATWDMLKTNNSYRSCFENLKSVNGLAVDEISLEIEVTE